MRKFEQGETGKNKEKTHYHEEHSETHFEVIATHESPQPVSTVSNGEKREKKKASFRSRLHDLIDPDEFEDDEQEAGIEHPENHPRFPLERKLVFYLGLAVLVVPVVLVAPTPFPSWILFPVLSPIALFIMALGVGKEHAKWHIKAAPRKVRIGIKNFLRGIFG